jgi:hypothetical protein
MLSGMWISFLLLFSLLLSLLFCFFNSFFLSCCLSVLPALVFVGFFLRFSRSFLSFLFIFYSCRSHFPPVSMFSLVSCALGFSWAGLSGISLTTVHHPAYSLRKSTLPTSVCVWENPACGTIVSIRAVDHRQSTLTLCSDSYGLDWHGIWTTAEGWFDFIRSGTSGRHTEN